MSTPDVGLAKCLGWAVMVVLVAILMWGCGGGGHPPTSSAKAAQEQGEAAARSFQSKFAACEGARNTSVAWAEAMEHVIHVYGEAGMYSALQAADTDSYKAEEATKKVAALGPKAAEAAARYESALGLIRRAAGEGLEHLTGALPEGTAAWKALVSACEASA